ncbi:hypothetical protein HDU78_007528 [Chytriomyces hyalinus]|nr:hypothetical protein HDU78_007528 [Chytriomyces hyalinus]
MDKLPVEVVQAILMHADMDAGLNELARVCRKFARILCRDVGFALAHVCLRFEQRPFEGELQDRLTSARILQMRLKKRSSLPFAYKAALFTIATRAGSSRLIENMCSVDTLLCIVQSLCTDHMDLVDWQAAILFFAETGDTATLDYVISNCAHLLDNHSLEKALTRACASRQLGVVSLLMTSCLSDQMSLDGSLTQAAWQGSLPYVQTLLNDPLQRITLSGRGQALAQSVYGENLAIAELLMERGVSVDALNYALLCAVRHESRKFLILFLDQPGIDPSFNNNACLLASVHNGDYYSTLMLIGDERVSIASNDYNVVRVALRKGLNNHVQFFLAVGQDLNDPVPANIVAEFLEQTPASELTRSLRAAIEDVQ